jgi:sialic acid synthase SpsE
MTTRQFNAGSRLLRDGDRPYVIAEIGVNHGGSLDLAKRLIELAHQGGADAAKFQTYKADTLASRHSPAYWDTTKEQTRSQHELFRKYDGFGPEEYRQLAVHCARVGIDFLSTPFDDAAVSLLDPLMPFFKIASADLTNVPFLRLIGRTGKPVVLSTGASTIGEIDGAVSTLRAAGCREIALLHCVLNYPTSDDGAHLGMIEGLRRCFPEHLIGYSDHTIPDAAMTAVTGAYMLGASIIEKHFTHDKSLPGNDHYHAMDVDDLRRAISQIEKARTLFGRREKGPTPLESPARQHARRSIVVKRIIQEGATITESDLTCKRPGTGVSPLHWDEVIGMTAARELAEDHVLQWSDVRVSP